MAKSICSDLDAGEALQVLQAIRVLQQWLVDRPMGADGLYLTAANLTFLEGQRDVATIALPACASDVR
jgi:hypothetical protein